MGRNEDLKTSVSLELLEVVEVLQVVEVVEVVRMIQTLHYYWPWILRVSAGRPCSAWPASRRSSS